MRPGRRRLVKRLIVHQRGAVRRLRELVPGACSGGPHLPRRIVAEHAGAVAADEGAELIELGALGDFDSRGVSTVLSRDRRWVERWRGEWEARCELERAVA